MCVQLQQPLIRHQGAQPRGPLPGVGLLGQQAGWQDLCLFGSFGATGALPAAGNWNGGAKSSIGLLRSGTGEWFIDRNGNHQWDGCGTDGCYSGFGAPGDLPVAGDWNGTGFAKIGVFRNGQW